MSDNELAKGLIRTSALTIGVGTLVGAGIFMLPGAAIEMPGPLAVGAFVLGGVRDKIVSPVLNDVHERALCGASRESA